MSWKDHMVPGGRDEEIESLRTQLSDALKRAEGAERERDTYKHQRDATEDKRKRLEADLARVTEERDKHKAYHFAALEEKGDVLSDLTAAQSRIQALEGMVGMLRNFIDAEVMPRYVDMFDALMLGDPETSVLMVMAQELLSLTESQAAEVVRGMDRVCEAAKVLKTYEWGYPGPDNFAGEIDAKDVWSILTALAALEAVRER